MRETVNSTGWFVETGYGCTAKVRERVEAASDKIISKSTAKELKRYLAFRHFFSHGYSFDLDRERIAPLVEGIRKMMSSFRADINNTIDEISDK